MKKTACPRDHPIYSLNTHQTGKKKKNQKKKKKKKAYRRKGENYHQNPQTESCNFTKQKQKCPEAQAPLLFNSQ